MLTIEEYLRNRIIGYELPLTVIKDVCLSPKEIGMTPLFLIDDAYPTPMDSDFVKRRDYAESTLYYMVTGMLSVTSYKKTIGNRSYSSAGVSINESEKNKYIKKADTLRQKWGLPKEEGDELLISDTSKLW